MSDILKKIVAHKRLELEAARRKVSLQDVRKMADDTALALPFLGQFSKTDINIIAEVKKASPSAGVIREDFDAVKIAHLYEDNGAQALSVLTDEKFFQGHLDFLRKIRKAVKLPVLRKDFTIDEYQIYEGRAAGADAILLIAAVLDDLQLSDYHELVIELGMTPLVEVHDSAELTRAAFLPLKLLGVNNRNLKTFVTTLDTTLDLQEKAPPGVPVISESGLKDHATLLRLKEAGVSGFLIGETFMRANDIGKKLREMLGTSP
jgi:indole-3-glycerol phosphate synthase